MAAQSDSLLPSDHQLLEHSKRDDHENDIASNCPAVTESQPQWLTWSLQWWWMTVLFLIEVVMIAAILCLDQLSAKHNGIASYPQTQASSSNFWTLLSPPVAWAHGLLWTTLPSLLLSIFTLMWGTIVSASSDRQPFVDLLKRPHSVACSENLRIQPAYGSYLPSMTWLVAFRNNHQVLGLSMILSYVLQLLVVPLAAHLMVEAPSQTSSTVALSFTTSFNESAAATTNLQYALELAMATRVHGAMPPSWMTLTYAFERFDVAPGAEQSGNVSVNAQAYSAQLDCQAFSAAESNASYDDGTSIVQYQVDDRGCIFTGYTNVDSSMPAYAVSWQHSCLTSQYGRIGILAGLYSDASAIKLANYSLVSCDVSFWVTSGTLTVSMQATQPPQFVSFAPQNSTTSYLPLLHELLDVTLHRYSFLDPSESLKSDAFGFSVYSCAQLASSMTPDVMKRCTEDMYATMYAGLASQTLLQTGDPPRVSTGELSSASNRIYVVRPVAYAIVGVLAVAVICNAHLFIHASLNRSILRVEPFVLIGDPTLLDERLIAHLPKETRWLCYGPKDSPSSPPSPP